MRKYWTFDKRFSCFYFSRFILSYPPACLSFAHSLCIRTLLVMATVWIFSGTFTRITRNTRSRREWHFIVCWMNLKTGKHQKLLNTINHYVVLFYYFDTVHHLLALETSEQRARKRPFDSFHIFIGLQSVTKCVSAFPFVSSPRKNSIYPMPGLYRLRVRRFAKRDENRIRSVAGAYSRFAYEFACKSRTKKREKRDKKYKFHFISVYFPRSHASSLFSHLFSFARRSIENSLCLWAADGAQTNTACECRSVCVDALVRRMHANATSTSEWRRRWYSSSLAVFSSSLLRHIFFFFLVYFGFFHSWRLAFLISAALRCTKARAHTPARPGVRASLPCGGLSMACQRRS